MTKLYELVGQILGKEPRKVYDKKSPFCGNLTYKITVLLDNEKKENFVFVYPNLVRSEIIGSIERSRYIDKRYLFFCEKKPKRWVLHNWEELPSLGK
ncbi:protein of unknown function [endosymbiont DhMRE of Dentiscutata heterogama]|uniref:hypothetical protein n=1 Tax=endosymbiont DhMRE of Dentiscutata heterogama TaxID=1609546 RepID=UPI000629D7CA|nr:hypothetical protein [endosymbiont DhMRE of Dentiscutata heterogama]CFW93082.1 protein of unknown function [endosymbiont DhMRE of Dentiscutata heterogama]